MDINWFQYFTLNYAMNLFRKNNERFKKNFVYPEAKRSNIKEV